jgi:Tat protein translocase TatB subunit
MFGIDSSELLIVAVAALIFIGPKDLPRVMMIVGRWVGRARGYARHFTAGIENIVREAELEADHGPISIDRALSRAAGRGSASDPARDE